MSRNSVSLFCCRAVNVKCSLQIIAISIVDIQCYYKKSKIKNDAIAISGKFIFQRIRRKLHDCNQVNLAKKFVKILIMIILRCKNSAEGQIASFGRKNQFKTIRCKLFLNLMLN